jgi:hypothetical protein
VREKSIRSSTVCTKIWLGVSTTGLLICFLRGSYRAKGNAPIFQA